MTTISRRALISMLPSMLPPVLIAGCAGVSISQVASDVDMIAAGVAAVLPLITGITGISQSIVAKVTAVVDEIKSVASDVAGSSATTSTIDLVKKLGAGVGTIVTLLGGLAVPAWVGTVLQAAGALLPTIENTLGFAAARRPGSMASAMTAAQARAILAAAAAQ